MLSLLPPGSGLARSATAAATAALLAMGVTGCEKDDGPPAAAKPVAKPSPGVKKLADNIGAGIASRHGATVTKVSCPPTLEVKAGGEVECQVHVEASDLPVEVVVTWTDDAGAFTWRDRGVIRLDKLEALVDQKLAADKKPGVVRCAGKVRSSKPESAFECPIEYVDGTKGAVAVRVRTWQGEVDLEFR